MLNRVSQTWSKTRSDYKSTVVVEAGYGSGADDILNMGAQGWAAEWRGRFGAVGRDGTAVDFFGLPGAPGIVIIM